MNRNTRSQLDGVHLIEADRHNLMDKLEGYNFDVIIDVCAYTAEDVNTLLDAVGKVEDYILISSSAVYPENNQQPFNEIQQIGLNSIWGVYGTNKIAAEEALIKRKADSYILRPPYLYGPMQNVYREPFVFECALADRKFYIPKDGMMKLQFFHVEDLCKVIKVILATHPAEHVYNVGNEELVDCVNDKNVITARANAYVDFAIEVAKELSLFVDENDLQETIDFWKYHKRVE